MTHTIPQDALAYSIAGITLLIRVDTPISEDTFSHVIQAYQVHEVGENSISLHHHFPLPDITGLNLEQEVYRKPPWAIYRDADNWIYLGITHQGEEIAVHQVAIFNHDHTRGHIYHRSEEVFRKGDLNSVSLLPTDQILLARVLADHHACYMHAAGMIRDGKGYLFVGHSGAGKSTTVKMLRDEFDLLCDDRMIIRRWPDGYRIHGTWSHGEIAETSPAGAPLRAILLLEQEISNQLVPVTDPREIVQKLPFFIIKPFITVDWWHKTLDLVGQIAKEVPVYRMQFDKSGSIKDVLIEL